MSKPTFDSTFGYRSNWTYSPVRSLRKDNQQTEQSDAQDSRDSVQNKRSADSEQSKSEKERAVENKNSKCPVEPFLITLALIEEMTNEAAE